MDGSYGEDAAKSRWMTLGGVMATDAVWGSFDESWIRMLAERYPRAPYIHMNELVQGVDPFEKIGRASCRERV